MCCTDQKATNESVAYLTLKLQTTRKNNGYTVEQVCIALPVTSDSVHQHSSYFIINGFIAFAIGVDLMLR
ncbi:hypothetical protein VCHA41O245_40021 [Vibrio chagasii]|nr:hypothetical protein VCHA41O245_40021 [Vibrio chagasii]